MPFSHHAVLPCLNPVCTKSRVYDYEACCLPIHSSAEFLHLNPRLSGWLTPSWIVSSSQVQVVSHLVGWSLFFRPAASGQQHETMGQRSWVCHSSPEPMAWPDSELNCVCMYASAHVYMYSMFMCRRHVCICACVTCVWVFIGNTESVPQLVEERGYQIGVGCPLYQADSGIELRSVSFSRRHLYLLSHLISPYA